MSPLVARALEQRRREQAAQDVTALALDVAGLMPELGSNVPERRLGPRKLRTLLRRDAEAEARKLARERAKVWEKAPVLDTLQARREELAERNARARERGDASWARILADRAAQAGEGERVCNQCWLPKPLADFIGRRGAPIKTCQPCAARIKGWTGKSTAEKLGDRERVDAAPLGRVRWVARSGNAKLGPMPVSMSEPGTCPPSCGLYLAGCYAMYGFLGGHWRKTDRQGVAWSTFLKRVRELPDGTLWRHNEAGDLPGAGEDIHAVMLLALVRANAGRRGFTFTHKHGSARNRALIAHANARGFTVNLSADTLEQADELAAEGGGRSPVVVLLPNDAPDKLTTPAGRKVVVCVAEQQPGMTCLECQLCAAPQRKSIVGFRAHGRFQAAVPELVQLRRKAGGGKAA